MTDKAEQPTITQSLWHSENVEGGIWSATFYFGKGDDARKAMRQFCDDHRTPSLAAQDGLVEALEDLQKAEADYRLAHDVHGNGDMRCGRAWDKMRRAGDKARTLLPAIKGDKS